MTQTYIKILDGTYAGTNISGTVLPLSKNFKVGKNGGYVTCDGKFFKKDRDIRVMLASPSNFQFVTVADYLAQDVTLDAIESKEIEITNESDEEVMARIAARFDILHDMTKAACEGNIRAMIVTGPPGVGKSFGVELEIERASLFDRVANRRVRSEVVKGSCTAIGLYQKLYEFSDANSVLVFDDSDQIFFDDLSLNILKAALDTSKRRKICWNSESSTLRREGIPESFDFKGAVIFITNLKFDNIKSKKIQDHLTALESRCHHIDLTIDTIRDKLLRIKQIAATGELFNNYDFSKTQEEEIIEFLFIYQSKFREISLRTAIKLADLYTSFPLKWKAIAKVTLMRGQ